ncbi:MULTISPECIES: BrnA antitoxin family protein [Rhizobium/Agrobacterium group]|jgi:uncharacterized protein (DUF4415 family)|uniref:BrnA antitoxin family protein n=2 Tax=Neorhizobium TaxID=1525371 RepID=A0ABV0M2P9_9HYPH|nr:MULTISPECIES: BrnA antitoxin family protein [Rhizobium/Agrobacterium group]KGD99505.1 hypothetical protein JL39_11755 [Rhizobium sp. YS-1r]MCC2609584.1 BrnA antitoxin family protein [Neorhizobium petrolearium]WGI69785.1 BrnA antitoxin family protein [Neorhizobium petrolearium]
MATKFSSKRPLTKEEEAEIQRMIASDPDAPEATNEELAKAKPFREALPHLAASIDRERARRGRPPIEKPRKHVSLRLDPDIIDHYKATGKGWQSRMNEALRKAAGL